MEETTTAALLSPPLEIRPSCASAARRSVRGRWCVSRTHTSTFTASPAKVRNKKCVKNETFVFSAHPHPGVVKACLVPHLWLIGDHYVGLGCVKKCIFLGGGGGVVMNAPDEIPQWTPPISTISETPTVHTSL